MGYQLTLRLPKELDTRVFGDYLCLEDVLVSTVFGAIAYGPPAMSNVWRKRFTTMPPWSPGVELTFWPKGQRVDKKRCIPDVFALDVPRGQALVVEAKREMPRADDLADQLISEGRAARATHKVVTLHLLVVADQASESPAFEEVRSRRPRLYGSHMRHTSWVELCGFLRDWKKRPECDAGHRRMIGDALAVMARYGYRPG